MKRLFLASLLALSAAPLFADQEISSDVQTEEPSEYDLLKHECAKGNTEANSVFINRNPKLREIKRKLKEKNWREGEMLGTNLLILINECEQGRNCKKYVKQVERLKVYKRVERMHQINQSVQELEQIAKEQLEHEFAEITSQNSEVEVTEQTDEPFVAH